MNLEIPELSLVVLVGPSGCGKSTFAARQFRATEVLESDAFRAMVADDPADLEASADAFEVLHLVAAKRLAAGRLTVVDATNVQSKARKPLVDLANRHHCVPVAIVFDLPERICQQWNRQRERVVPRQAIHRHAEQLRRSVGRLHREGFRVVHVLSSPEAVDRAVVTRQPMGVDRRDLHGPFDIVGDVHGCIDELLALLGKLGWEVTEEPPAQGAAAATPADPAPRWLARHPDGRTAVFLGDLVDRGPDTPGVLRLVVAHAGLREELQGRASREVRRFASYGETTGETDEYGLPVRFDWTRDYRGRAMVVYGHTPVERPGWVNRTICVDTGCVFGGRLTALRYPERELVSVPAARTYFQPARPLGRLTTDVRDAAPKRSK